MDEVSRVRAELNSAHPEAIDLKICEQLFASLFPDDAGKILEDSSEIILIPDDALFVLPFEMYSPQASKGNFPLLKYPQPIIRLPFRCAWPERPGSVLNGRSRF